MNMKRTAIIAASAATVFSLAVAAPSFAHGVKIGTKSSATETETLHATVAVTISGIPTTITDAQLAARGAKFVAYALAADATTVPATQPTSGAKSVKLTGISITEGVLTGTLSIDAGAASTTTNYAIYNAAGEATFVVVTVDATGIATAFASTPITAAYVAPITVAKEANIHATIAVTVTGIPTTVTDLKSAARGAKFVAYKLAADATALPATQPTTGGKPVNVTGTSIVEGSLTGTLSIDAGAASTTTNYAIYNAAGVGVFVTVATDATGVATVTTSAALVAAYVEPTAPALGKGKSVKSERGKHLGRR